MYTIIGDAYSNVVIINLISVIHITDLTAFVLKGKNSFKRFVNLYKIKILYK